MRILYLDLDTLRPDHLGCYGYHRNTSPNIDAIASQGLRFDNYYCSDAPCLPSRTALMTGRFGIHTGVVNHGGTNADIRIEGKNRRFHDHLYSESLPAMLRNSGLHTVSISPFATRHSSWSFYAGFNEMHDTGKSGGESAEEITPTALDWIRHNATRDNWFLQVNYWDPHTPYRAPEELGNPFKDDPIPDWVTQEILEKQRMQTGCHCPRELRMWDNKPIGWPRQPSELKDMNDVRMMFDGYDCGIRHMDNHIGMLFDEFEKLKIMDDLAIIISSDHGENMGELGIWGEHGTSDQITHRIPMIIRWPGVKVGSIDTGLHYNLDLGPTLAQLLGQESKPSWDGSSYAQAVIENKDNGRAYLVLSQCCHVCQRSVRFGDWIYIRTYHDGYRLCDTEQLYNIVKDPHEQFNVANENVNICSKAVYYLNEWHDNMMLSSSSDTDPMWTVIREGGPFHAKGVLPRYCEYLKETGREYAIPELKKRHPMEFV